MSSLKQVEANRRNAALSTGPTTPEGRAVSRFNALKSGIDSAAEVALPTESLHDLSILKTEYVERFTPRNPEERCLVDTLINCEWLLRRFRTIEGQLLTRSCKDLKQSEERFCLGGAFEENSRSLERLQRRINATTRTFMKTLECLKQLQEDRKPLPIRRPQVQSAQPREPEIGFVPQFPPVEPKPPAATPESRGPGLPVVNSGPPHCPPPRL